MKKRILVTLLAMVMVFSMAFSMTGCGGEEEAAAATWGDRYVALLDSGEARANADYDAMQSELAAIAEETGATYVYVLTPGTDGEPDIAGKYDEGASFLITVDGCDDPDDWATDYGWEKQFTEAWEGTPASARSAWNDSDTEQCWSGFAPVYDSEGTVVALLGIDYPATEVAQAYPEWNRDADEWNGFEDEITGDVPTEVADMRQYVETLAAKYAAKLSGQPTWADQYVALLESGEARDYEGYEALRSVLADITEATGTTYCYVLTPGTDGVPDIAGASDNTGAYLITVDPCEDPDDWATDYGWEAQFTEAWEGEPAAARSAWNESDTEQCWSGFAPVYDSEGTVVALLGFDYPATEVAQAYPEWNRDAAEWNGIEDEITVEVPQEVQDMRTFVSELAAKYAAAL